MRSSKPQEDIILTPKQTSLIIGHLLGDGSVRRNLTETNGKTYMVNSALTLMRKAADKEYAEYSCKVLRNLLTCDKVPLTVKDKFDKRTEKNYPYVSFNTRNLTVLNDFRSKWYDANGKKIVPLDLELNAEIIAIWFCDDGCITIDGGIGISFATDSFSKTEVMFLISILEKRYQSPFSLGERQKPGGNSYTIDAPTHASIRIIKDIDNVMPEGMERKRIWTEDILEQYKDVPSNWERESTRQDNRDVIREYLSKNCDFSMADIGVSLDWWVYRTDRPKEIASRKVMEYVKPYIEQELVATNKVSRERFFSITAKGKEFFLNGDKL